ncbi:MAG: ribonucleoside triphosphate reductase, partial [Spirochaetes bacterium]
VTGSIGVVTINLARLGYLAKDEDEFFEKLRYYMDLAKESLEIKRKICNDSFEKGLMPFSKIFLKNLDNHFSTIGVVGGHECCENFSGCSIADEEGLKFIIKVLNFMRNVLVEYQEETGNLWNLEATPAEGASYRLAKIDARTLKNCYVSGTRREPFYTNSTQLPVDYTQVLGKAIRHQEQLQILYTGGTVFHAFLPERPDERVIPFLVQRLVERTKLPYFTITPTFSVCQNCHRDFSGEQPICPVCGSATDVWSRVVGYYSPVRVWNRGKKQEWKSRVNFNLSEMN